MIRCCKLLLVSLPLPPPLLLALLPLLGILIGLCPQSLFVLFLPHSVALLRILQLRRVGQHLLDHLIFMTLKQPLLPDALLYLTANKGETDRIYTTSHVVYTRMFQPQFTCTPLHRAEPFPLYAHPVTRNNTKSHGGLSGCERSLPG